MTTICFARLAQVNPVLYALATGQIETVNIPDLSSCELKTALEEVNPSQNMVLLSKIVTEVKVRVKEMLTCSSMREIDSSDRYRPIASLGGENGSGIHKRFPSLCEEIRQKVSELVEKSLAIATVPEDLNYFWPYMLRNSTLWNRVLQKTENLVQDIFYRKKMERKDFSLEFFEYSKLNHPPLIRTTRDEFLKALEDHIPSMSFKELLECSYVKSEHTKNEDSTLLRKYKKRLLEVATFEELLREEIREVFKREGVFPRKPTGYDLALLDKAECLSHLVLTMGFYLCSSGDIVSSSEFTSKVKEIIIATARPGSSEMRCLDKFMNYGFPISNYMVMLFEIQKKLENSDPAHQG